MGRKGSLKSDSKRNKRGKLDHISRQYDSCRSLAAIELRGIGSYSQQACVVLGGTYRFLPAQGTGQISDAQISGSVEDCKSSTINVAMRFDTYDQFYKVVHRADPVVDMLQFTTDILLNTQ